MGNQRIIFFIVIGLLIILGVWLFSRQQWPIDWRETYKETSKEPYGTAIIYDLLESYFPSKRLTDIKQAIHKEFKDDSINGNYVFVGEAVFADSMDIQALLDFVGRGNKAFISSKTIPYDLMFYIYNDECDDYWDDYSTVGDSSVSLNFAHPDLRVNAPYPSHYQYQDKKLDYAWRYIPSFTFCEVSYMAPLGFMNDTLVNFAQVDYESGTFYLHTTPIAFSNLQMLEESGVAYASKVFSHLKEGDIYWDVYSRVPERFVRDTDDPYTGNRRISANSPLEFILSQPPLAWAWYILLGIGLLYLLFMAKRRQRTIPVKEPHTNTSLEYISTVGRLYFLQNNHKQLALKKMKLFLSYVRERYNIQTRDLDALFVKQLANKSEVSATIIDKILLLNQNIERSSFVSENTLVQIHEVIDTFYKNRK